MSDDLENRVAASLAGIGQQLAGITASVQQLTTAIYGRKREICPINPR